MHEVKSSEHKSDLSVYIRNNGSSDETVSIMARAGQAFTDNNIIFASCSEKENQGFDSNVINCYKESPGEYVWFLSDDDNIRPGSIDTIFCDIDKFQPHVIYYNFDQPPYDQANPYLAAKRYFKEVSQENVDAVKKIIHWPKLTSLIIRRCPAGLEVPDIKTGFAHVMLALHIGLANGEVLHSPSFIAYPDADYLDHIDFVPYIGNNLNDCIKWALAQNEKKCLWEVLQFPQTDPLVSSLERLRQYYRGQCTLTIPLKQELWHVCRKNIIHTWHQIITNREILVQTAGLLKTLLRYSFFAIVFRQKIGRIRQVPSNS